MSRPVVEEIRIKSFSGEIIKISKWDIKQIDTSLYFQENGCEADWAANITLKPQAQPLIFNKVIPMDALSIFYDDKTHHDGIISMTRTNGGEVSIKVESLHNRRFNFDVDSRDYFVPERPDVRFMSVSVFEGMLTFEIRNEGTYTYPMSYHSQLDGLNEDQLNNYVLTDREVIWQEADLALRIDHAIACGNKYKNRGYDGT